MKVHYIHCHVLAQVISLVGGQKLVKFFLTLLHAAQRPVVRCRACTRMRMMCSTAAVRKARNNSTELPFAAFCVMLKSVRFAHAALQYRVAV